MKLLPVSTDPSAGFMKRLITPLVLGLPMALALMKAVQVLEIRALTLLLVAASFLCFSIMMRRFERILLGLVFFMVPMNVDVNFEIGPTLYSMALPQGTALLNLSVLDILVCALYPMWVVRLMTNRSERMIWPAGAYAFLAFTAWGLLSAINAQNKLLSVVEVACFLKTFLIFFYLSNNIKTKEDVWFAVKCLLAGLFLQCLIACGQQKLQHNIGLGILGERKEEKVLKIAQSQSTVFRVGGTLGHPTFLGGYLSVLLPICLALVLQPFKGIKKLVIWGIFALASLVMIFSYCRSAWIVTAISLPLMFARWYREYLKTHPFKLSTIVFAVLAAGILIAPMAPKINARMTQDDKGSTDSRLPQWKMGMEMIKAHPILGVGLNNYNVVSESYEPYVVDASTKTRVFVYYAKLHNLYLGVAAQTGLVGMFLYIYFLFSILYFGWKKMKLTEDTAIRGLFAGMILGLVAMLFHESVHTGNISNNMILWTVASILVSVAGPEYRSHHETK